MCIPLFTFFTFLLIGEGCLDTFYNALVVNKLTDITTKIIPQSAKVFLCAIESEYLRRTAKFTETYKSGDKPKIVNAVCLENACEFEKSFIGGESDFAFEPYTTENLKNINYVQLTDCIQLDEFNLDFADTNNLEKYCKFNEIATARKKLKCNRSGHLDAYVIWFDLNLDDEIVLTNSPFLDSNTLKHHSTCWHQALYLVHEEVLVNFDEEIQADVSMTKDFILVKPTLVKPEVSQNEPQTIKLLLNRSEIAQLNNFEYQKFYCDWLENVFKNYPKNETLSKINLNIGYVSTTFSKVFFQLIFEYHVKFKVEKNIFMTLHVFVSNVTGEESKNFDLNFKKNFTNLYEFLEVKNLSHMLNKLLNNEKEDLFLDFLICEPLDKYGTLRKNILSDLLLIKDLNINKGKYLYSNIFQCDIFQN